MTPPVTAAEPQPPVVIVIPEEPPSFNAAITGTGYDTMVMKLVVPDESVRRTMLVKGDADVDMWISESVAELLLVTTMNADGYSPRMQGIQANDNDVVTWYVAGWRIAP